MAVELDAQRARYTSGGGRRRRLGAAVDILVAVGEVGAAILHVEDVTGSVVEHGRPRDGDVVVHVASISSSAWRTIASFDRSITIGAAGSIGGGVATTAARAMDGGGGASSAGSVVQPIARVRSRHARVMSGECRTGGRRLHGVYTQRMTESLVAVRDRREQVIARLSQCFAEDVLEIDELERRLDLAHAARTLAELDALVADLAPTTSTALVPAAPQAIEDPTRAATKKVRVIMSTIERRGRWLVPKELVMRVFWGTAELDFRDASLQPGVTTIDVRVTMGNLEIILPPNLAIDVDVSSIAGNVEERHRVPAELGPGQPMLRIIGAVRFGNLEISTRLPGETGGDARRREKRERKQLRSKQQALPPG